MDGIDAVLVDFSRPQPKLIQSLSHPWPADVRHDLIEARKIPDDKLSSLNALDIQTAEIFAEACLKLLATTSYKAIDIKAVGNHGQTIRHRPEIENPFSLQIGNAQVLADLTGIDVVSDFRTADIESGGQGAPLVPAFHQQIFNETDCDVFVVNIGGIANISYLPGTNLLSTKQQSKHVLGFDTGPGNALMDDWYQCHHKESKNKYDKDGAWASEGVVNKDLLTFFLSEPYLKLPAPKSTGREYFNPQWLEQKLKHFYHSFHSWPLFSLISYLPS